MLFFGSNYAKNNAFCPTLCQIIPIMLRTRSAWSSTQQARTSACMTEIHIYNKGIQTLSWYWCKPNSITEGEEKGRVSQAHAMIRSRASFWVEIRMHWLRVTRTLTLVHGLKNVVPATSTSNFVVAGHRPVLTDRKTQFSAAYSSESDNGRTISNCFTESYFIFCQNYWCRVLWHRLLRIAKSCLLGKMPSLC